MSQGLNMKIFYSLVYRKYKCLFSNREFYGRSENRRGHISLKNHLLCEKSYRPVSILAFFSKIFEKIVYEEIKSHMEPVFFIICSGFRQSVSDRAILMDLSKAFVTLNYNYF